MRCWQKRTMSPQRVFIAILRFEWDNLRVGESSQHDMITKRRSTFLRIHVVTWLVICLWLVGCLRFQTLWLDGMWTDGRRSIEQGWPIRAVTRTITWESYYIRMSSTRRTSGVYSNAGRGEFPEVTYEWDVIGVLTNAAVSFSPAASSVAAASRFPAARN